MAATDDGRTGIAVERFDIVKPDRADCVGRQRGRGMEGGVMIEVEGGRVRVNGTEGAGILHTLSRVRLPFQHLPTSLFFLFLIFAFIGQFL